MVKLRARIVGEGGFLGDVFDADKSGAVAANYHFDLMPKPTWLTHIACHTPGPEVPHQHTPDTIVRREDGIIHESEHWIFKKDIWCQIMESYPAVNPGYQGETLLEETRRIFDPIVQACNFANIDEYLDLCEKVGYCLVSPLILRDVNGQGIPASGLPNSNRTPKNAHLDYAPHKILTGDYDSMLRVYAGVDPSERMMDYRYCFGRVQHYGPGKPNGARASANFIEPRFWHLFQRVGLSHNDHQDLASSRLPIPIHSTFEVSWRGSGVSNAQLRPIRENYARV